MIGHVVSAVAAAFAAVILDPSTTITLDPLWNATENVIPESVNNFVAELSDTCSCVTPYAVTALRYLYNALVFLVLTYLFEAFRKTGIKGLAGAIVRGLRIVPGVNELILAVLQGEIKSSLKELTNEDSAKSKDSKSVDQPILPIPEHGLGRAKTLEVMDKEQAGDGDHCHEGRAFAFSYFNDTDRFEGHTAFLAEVYARFAEKVDVAVKDTTVSNAVHNDKNLDQLAQEVFRRYAHGNALNPLMFPTLRKYETEVLSMTAAMLNGDNKVVGALTSGGTESILMTVRFGTDSSILLFFIWFGGVTHLPST